MRTRRGLSYPIEAAAVNACDIAAAGKRKATTNCKRGKPDFAAGDYLVSRKKNRLISTQKTGGNDLFDSLPDDLVISILCKLSSSASCPTDFINVSLTCVYFLLSYLSICFFFFLSILGYLFLMAVTLEI